MIRANSSDSPLFSFLAHFGSCRSCILSKRDLYSLFYSKKKGLRVAGLYKIVQGNLSKRTLYGNLLIPFDDISNLQIIEIGNAQAAFISCNYFLHIVFKSP